MAESDAPPGYRRFLAEMRRRHVFRVAGVYGATAFVVLQVAELLGQGLRLPDTFLTVVTVLAIVCFPIALLISWAYERTPDGVQRTDMLTSGEVNELAALPAIRRPKPPPDRSRTVCSRRTAPARIRVQPRPRP